MNTLQKRHPLTTFFMLVYAITWSLQGALIASKISIGTTPEAVVNIATLYVPFAAALMVAKICGQQAIAGLRNGLRKRYMHPGWHIFAAGLPPALLPGASVAASNVECCPP